MIPSLVTRKTALDPKTMLAANDADNFVKACFPIFVVALGSIKLVVEDSAGEVVNDEAEHHGGCRCMFLPGRKGKWNYYYVSVQYTW